MMELGATVCKPRSPLCPECPFKSDCKVLKSRRNPEDLPRKAPKKSVPHFHIGAAIVRKNGRILITKRPDKGLLGGLWEFPGGKQEKGETLPACVRRELKEELSIRVAVGDLFCSVDHAYSHFKITLHCFDCRHLSGTIQNLGVAGFKWVFPRELKKFAFPKADRVVIEKLISSSSI
jgi:A/G-specific adenine glycosylase